jgi:hypothetical protein
MSSVMSKERQELTIEQLKKSVQEILEGVKSGTIDYTEVEAVIDYAQTLAETWVLHHEYLERKKRNPDLCIDFMESTELDNLPSKQELGELKALIALTRKNFKKRAGS